MDRLWCITALFNPAGFRSRYDNYHTFRTRLDRQGVPLLTVELAFPGQEHGLLADRHTIHLRGGSVMWQKERLLNVALAQLPVECDRVAWLDADVLLPDGWQDLLMDQLERVEFIQLFERVVHLAPGETAAGGTIEEVREGLVWQSQRYGNDWIPLRLQARIGRAEPGCAWAARRAALAGGFYDRLICGSGDTFLADCLLESEQLHLYWPRYTDRLLEDMDQWRRAFRARTARSVTYLPVDIYHLWHGRLKDRGYHGRNRLFRRYNYDPRTDIKLVGGVWEWATDKPLFHEALIDYFRHRNEDGEPAATPP